jgi:type I restriction enzyme S subunit
MKMATLGDIADWGSGGTPSRSVAQYFGEGIPWLSIADLNDGLIFHAKESLTPAGVANSAAKVVPAGTLFVAMYGSIGKLGIAARDFATSQAIAFARPKTNMVDTRFLFHFLLAQRPRLTARGRGGTQMNISQGDLKAWPISLPPLDEQRRIAAVLDAADAVRSKRKAIVAQLDSLTTAVFDHEFADFDTTVYLTEAVEEFRYGTSNKSGDSGYPTLRIPNVVGGALSTDEIKTVAVTPSELSRLTLRDGDLLFVRTNGNADNVGRSAVFSSSEVRDCGFGDSPWIYASYLIRARLRHGFDANFVAAYLRTGHGRAQLRERSKTSAGQFNINTESLGSIKVPDVPFADQQAFAALVARIDTQRGTVQRALAADDELFASLQTRAFSGKL